MITVDGKWVGVNWSDDYPHYRILVTRDSQGVEEEIWRGTLSMFENEAQAYEECEEQIKKLRDGTREE